MYSPSGLKQPTDAPFCNPTKCYILLYLLLYGVRHVNVLGVMVLIIRYITCIVVYKSTLLCPSLVLSTKRLTPVSSVRALLYYSNHSEHTRTMHTSSFFSLPLLALAGSVAAQSRGFNYGALYADYRARTQQDFERDFTAARTLPGASGFTSARLFTMIQGYTQNTVISAIPAAIATNTSLLLGLWGSAGQEAFNQELTALRNAISQFPAIVPLIVGISVGSEDLYRISPTGIENHSNPGAGPDTLVRYVQQTRQALAGTRAAGKGIGHVDTWTAYVNASNNALIAALDWVGVDGYPYYEVVNANGIENAEKLFFQSYDATVAAAQGKPVWVTETGWPVTGPQSGAATAGAKNAERYWKSVGCRLFKGSTNVWWYQLNDGQTDQSATSFRVINADRAAPQYNLSC